MKPLHFLASVSLVLAGIAAQTSFGVVPPKHERLADLDKRIGRKESPSTAARPVAPSARAEAVAGLQAKLPSVQVDFNELTGAPAWVYARDSFLTGPVGGAGVGAAQDSDQELKVFLREQRQLFGFGEDALNAARVKREFVTAHNQLRTVVWQQELDGLEIFEAVLIAHTTSRGELVNVASGFLANPAQAAGDEAQRQTTLELGPVIAAEDAVCLAAVQLGDAVEHNTLEPGGEAAAGAERRQSFRAKALNGDAGVRLLWLPINGTEMRLCWEVLLTSRTQGEMFRTLVDAETGEIWLRRSLTSYISDATYRVFTSDSPSPLSPGHPTPLTSQPPIVPRSLVTLSALSTNASPGGWINDGVNETRGNNVDAHTDTNNDNQPDLPRPQGAPFRTFDFPLNLTQPPSASAANAVVQLFYWCNWMHDQLYALGFTEAAGNFQVNNFSRGGLGNDAVSADAQDGGGTDNANMSTPPDGSAPRMQMYVFTGSTPDRDGDYDAEVILHEYTHGLSNRRVGGGIGISTLQAAGMGEGWSDFYGLALLSAPGDDVNGNYAPGGYLTFQLIPGFEQNYYFGIRRYPYSTDLSKNPLTFRDIDADQADPHAGVPLSPLFVPWSAAFAPEVHCQGEVWCVTLWEARANLINKHGFAVGNQLILQLVTDGMNLSPANPNFLQARDAILQADRVNNGGANLPELWAAFAKRGMGFSATSPSSLTTTGVREAFDLPDDLLVTPLTDLVATGPVGGPFAPASATYTLTNHSANLVVWTVLKSAGWLNVSSTGGTLPPGSPAVTVTVSIDPVVNNFPPGTYTDSLRFSNQVTHAVQARPVFLIVGAVDYFTELFDDFDNDLDNQMFTLTPDGSESFYSVCRQTAASFPTDPTGGAVLALSDDSFTQITLTGGATVAIYTNRSGVLYVGSNGYLTQGQGDSDFSQSLSRHFSLPRVAGLFRDLDPGSGGTVSWRQLGDRVAVTYLNVPEFGNAGTTNRFQIELFFDGRIRVTYLNLRSTDGLAGLSRGTGVPLGFTESDMRNYGACALPWQLIAPTGANEEAGVLTGQGVVQLGQPLATNLVVSLASGDLTELTVTANVVVLAGQTNAAFDLTVVDDLELDGTQTASLRATAPGYRQLTTPFRVYDNETNTILVSLPATAREGDAPLAGTISVATAPPVAVVIELTSSDVSELQVPPLVVIPAGQTSAIFSATVVNDREIDGPRNATLTAHVQNWAGGAATVTVLDDESAALAVILPVSAMENRGAWLNGGQVQLSGITLTNLTVTLSSSLPGQLSVPVSVAVLAGQSNRTFTLTCINDALPNGDRAVSISGSAAGFGTASGSMTIVDDDTPPVMVVQPSDQVIERGSPAAFVVTVNGGLPMSHQWWFSNQISGAAPVGGAVQTNLVLSNVDFPFAGQYWIVSSNAFGAAVSTRATLAVLPGVTLAEALDTTNLNWTTTGNGLWRGQTTFTHDGVDAGASGDLANDQQSSVQTTVVGPGTLTFWWRVSSESNYDYLRFYRAGLLQTSISGEVNWTQRTYSLPAGTQTLLWTYSKDGSVDTGEDRGWLDQVSYAPTGSPVIVTQPQNQIMTAGSNATFTVVASGLAPLRYQWRLAGTNLLNATNTVLTLVNVSSNSAGIYSVRVTNALGAVVSANAALTLNRVPVANPQSVALAEDAARVIALSGSDPDGNALTYMVLTAPTHGTLSGTPPNLTYRPATNYFGADEFSFVVNDSRVASAPATVSITVQPVADAPIAFPQTITVNEDASVAVTLAATDPDGDSLTYLVSLPAHGSLTGTVPSMIYHPATNYHGADAFSFQARDGLFSSAAATVTITVLPVNDVPVARITLTPLMLFPTITNQLIVAPDGLSAKVGLDGSQSSDSENDPLNYNWLEGTNVLSTAMTATNPMNIGSHTVTLAVDDGKVTGAAATTFDVLTPAQSIGVIILVIEESNLTRQLRHSLEVTLKAAAASFERGDTTPALNQLRALQNKVNAQVSPTDPAFAAQLTGMIQALTDAMAVRDELNPP